jgi:formiminoglutamase
MPEPDMSVWTGRVDTADGPNALRWHQMVAPLAPDSPPGIVLIGFACDEGVRRNGGRVGAKNGPRAIRQALANLAWHLSRPVYDAGDVRCDDTDMEGAQSRLAEVVADAIRTGHNPLVLGGGHETAWGTFQGIVAARPEGEIGIINIDAHFDLRADEPGNSGTPFRQIADWCYTHQHSFRYQAHGIAPPSNTPALFERARSWGVGWSLDVGLAPWQLDPVLANVRTLAEEVDYLYLSIDLDVFPASAMPAVSAPAARGVPVEAVEAVVGMIVKDTKKLIAVDVVELNPTHDIDRRGAALAARLVWHLLTRYGD